MKKNFASLNIGEAFRINNHVYVKYIATGYDRNNHWDYDKSVDPDGNNAYRIDMNDGTMIKVYVGFAVEGEH